MRRLNQLACFAAAVIGTFASPRMMNGEVLEAGEGRQFATLCTAIEAASTGDVVVVHGNAEVDAACSWSTPGVHIQGAKGSTLVAEGGAWIVAADDTTVERLELVNTGIEMAGQNLTLRRLVIHGAAIGVRTRDNAAGQLTIEDSKIYSNGVNIDVQTHLAGFRLLSSRIETPAEGSSVNAGAAVNEIRGNRLTASDSGSGRADLVLAAGRDHMISGNLFVKRSTAAQYPFILYVTSDTPGGFLDLANNTFASEAHRSVKFVEVSGDGTVAGTASANIFWGTGAVDEKYPIDPHNNYAGTDEIFIAGTEYAVNAASLRPDWGANLTSGTGSATEVPEHSAEAGTKSPRRLTLTATSVASLFLSQTSVTGAGFYSGNTVTLNAPAPSGGVTVLLISDNPLVAKPYYASILIAAGQTTGTFYMRTFATTSIQQATIKAALGLSAATKVISVGPVSLSGIVAERTTLGSGMITAQNRINMTGPVPGNTVITLQSSSPLLTVPSSVTIPAGVSSTGFQMTAGTVTSPVSVTVTATHATGTRSIPITVQPVTLQSASFLIPSITVGTRGYVRIYLTGPAPAGGLPIVLSSSNPTVYPIQPLVTVPAGAKDVLVPTIANTVLTSTPVTVTCTYRETVVTATATVIPVALKSIATSALSVSARGSVTLTISLTGTAPTGGFTVALASSQSSALQVPASVVVPAGYSYVTFTAIAGTVPASIAATVTGRAGTASKSTVITINP